MLKLAVAQFVSDTTVEGNRRKLVELAERAAEDGADLITFHEIANTHYFCYDEDETSHFDLAEPISGPTVTAMTEVADRHDLSIALPMYEADGEGRYNTVAYIEPGRGVVAKYRKTHVPITSADSGQKGANEAFYFSAGDTGFSVWDGPDGLRVGSLICFDRHFPEGARAYAVNQADLVVVPTASYRGFIIQDLWEAELQSMAFQNGFYVVGVNKVGPVVGEGVPDGATYPGRSLVVSPEGKILCSMGGEEGVMMAEIDPSLPGRVRSGAMKFMERRRPEMYADVARGQ